MPHAGVTITTIAVRFSPATHHPVRPQNARTVLSASVGTPVAHVRIMAALRDGFKLLTFDFAQVYLAAALFIHNNLSAAVSDLKSKLMFYA